ncbi:hypothetical protein RUM43_012175 [Polyplax serrata]|uniref:Uncharacterized protein n=1 Tax=Polyplax serrata TaxID=468196 RepID=A0AAN8PTH1_POLSC
MDFQSAMETFAEAWVAANAKSAVLDAPSHQVQVFGSAGRSKLDDADGVLWGALMRISDVSLSFSLLCDCFMSGC